MEKVAKSPEKKSVNEYEINKNGFLNTIEKYTWWVDVQNRKWVVVERYIDVSIVDKEAVWTGNKVALLQENSEAPKMVAWMDIVDMIMQGKMKKYKPT